MLCMQLHVSRAPTPASKDTRVSCAGIYVRTYVHASTLVSFIAIHVCMHEKFVPASILTSK